jgi:hypothetical protein
MSRIISTGDTPPDVPEPTDIDGTFAIVLQGINDLHGEILDLNERIDKLEDDVKNGTRKPKVDGEPGICAVTGDPVGQECSSSTVYRYQRGCKGAACLELGRQYYRDYYVANRSKE